MPAVLARCGVFSTSVSYLQGDAVGAAGVSSVCHVNQRNAVCSVRVQPASMPSAMPETPTLKHTSQLSVLWRAWWPSAWCWVPGVPYCCVLLVVDAKCWTAQAGLWCSGKSAIKGGLVEQHRPQGIFMIADKHWSRQHVVTCSGWRAYGQSWG